MRGQEEQDLNKKREAHRFQIRSSQLNKLLSTARQIVTTQLPEKMITSEDQYFQALRAKKFAEENYLSFLKECEDYYSDTLFTQIVKPQLEAIFQKFASTEEHVETLVHIFLHLTKQDEQVIFWIHHYKILFSIVGLLSPNQSGTRLQHLAIFFCAQLVQYSPIYRVALKNMDVVNMVLFNLQSVPTDIEVDINYIESFNFLVWSFINPTLKGVEDIIEQIFPLLLLFAVKFVDINSQFLLSILFRSAQEIPICRARLLEFPEFEQIVASIQRKETQQQIILDFLSFIDAVLIQELEPPDFLSSPLLANVLICLISLFYDEIKIRSACLIQELLRMKTFAHPCNNLTNFILDQMQRTLNQELTSAYVGILQILLCQSQLNPQNPELVTCLISCIKNQAHQISSLWMFLLFLVEQDVTIVERLKQTELLQLIESLTVSGADNYLLQIMEKVEKHLRSN